MGKEQLTTLSLDGRELRGKALLETDEIIFTPEPKAKRIVLKKTAIARIEVKGDALVVTTKKKERYALSLGAAQAQKWKDKIENPPSLMDKLGIKPGTSVAIAGAADAAFEKELHAQKDLDVKSPGKEADLCMLFIASKAELAKAIAKHVKRAGALWIVYPKGQTDPKESDVIGAGRAAGLKDVKVARFSDTHTALKFVAPKA